MRTSINHNINTESQTKLNDVNVLCKRQFLGRMIPPVQADRVTVVHADDKFARPQPYNKKKL